MGIDNQVTTIELRQNLRALLNKVEFKDQTVTITRNGKACAKIVPLDADVVVTDPVLALPSAKITSEITKKPHKPR